MAYIRTEDEQIGKMPIPVKLGDTEYQVKVLAINKNLVWRKKLTDTMSEVLSSFQNPVSKDGLADGLTVALLSFPEKIMELLFAYSPELEAERETILETATEEQFAAAFSRVMTVAYPFFAQLGTITQAIKATSNQRQ